MKILILGGTLFVGRHLVEAALKRNHEITLFHRGQTNRDLFLDVEKLYGDRQKDLSILKGRRWDALIDTCGYLPKTVEASASFLANAVDRYTFISTISVYQDVTKPNMDETATLATTNHPDTQEIRGESYGALKALCEKAVEKAMPGRVCHIRPGLIVGPYDPSDRFTYWPHRVSLGGEILAPGNPDQTIQFIDVRDLADWTIQMTETKKTGIFNATGSAYPLTMQTFLSSCQEIAQSNAFFTWADEAFLEKHGVMAYTEMPLWVPEALSGFSTINIQKALAHGLTFRPLKQTIQDTLSWHQQRDLKTPLRAGLNPDRERELLQALSRQKGTNA